MDIQVTDWTIPGSDGQPIYGNTHMPYEGPSTLLGSPFGTLICCHGFKGYKDYGFIPLLCDFAARAGLNAIRFNFSHSGMTNRAQFFEHPELFEQDTWARQVSDLQTLLAIGRTHGSPNLEGIPQNSSKPVVFFGHSRGGDTSLLTAARLMEQSFYDRPSKSAWPNHPNTRLAGLITAAAPDYACNLDDLVKDQLRAEDRLLSPSGRTGQDLYIGLGWLEEIERDPELYDPVLAAAHVKCPMLVIHGDADETVPLDCANSLHKAATPNSRLEIIEGANHVFNCPNPVPEDMGYEQLPEQTRRMIELSVDFAVACCDKARANG